MPVKEILRAAPRVGRVTGAPEDVPFGHTQYLKAVKDRQDWINRYLDANPKRRAVYDKAKNSGDVDKLLDYDEAISNKIMEDKGKDAFDYMVIPSKKKISEYQRGRYAAGEVLGEEVARKGEALIRKGYETFRKKGMPKMPAKPMSEWVETVPAQFARLYEPRIEKFYQEMELGLRGNLWARKSDQVNYIKDDLMMAYGALVRERNPGEAYSRHKNYKALLQRSGEALAGLGIGPTTEQWSEFAASAIPFREDFIEAFASEEELKYRAKVETLMSLADRSTSIAQLGGKITGLLVGGLGIYRELGKRGLVQLMGVGKAKAARNIFWTGLGEAGLDLAFNKQGYTLVLGSMLGADQNRLVSASEAVAFGTALNLGIDFIRSIRGKSRHTAMFKARAALGKERGHLIDLLQARVRKLPGKKDVAGVDSILKQDPVEMTFPKGETLGPITPQETTVLKSTMMDASAESWAHVKTLETQVENLKIHPMKDTALKRKKIADKENQIHALKTEMGLFEVGDQLRINQMARDKIKANAGATVEEMEKRIGSAFPEEPMIDVNRWIDRANEAAPGWDELPSSMSAREALRRGTLHTIGLSFLGGGLAMPADDEERWGAVMGGMLLPISPGLSRRTQAFLRGGKEFMRHRWRGFKEWRGTKSEQFGYNLSPWLQSVRRAGGEYTAMRFRKARLRSMGLQLSRAERGVVWFEHMQQLEKSGILSAESKSMIYRALQEGDEDKAIKAFNIIDDHPSRPAHSKGETEYYFEAARGVLREMGKDGLETGALAGLSEVKYWPRSIKPDRYKDFLEDFRIKKDPRIKRMWDLEAAKTGKPLTNVKKVEIANDVVNTYGFASKGKGGKLSFSKTRVFKQKIPDEMVDYYESLEQTYFHYVGGMTESIEISRLLGKGKGMQLEDLKYAVEEIETPRVTAEDKALVGPMPKKKVKGRGYRKPKHGTGTVLRYEDSIGDALRREFEADNVKPGSKQHDELVKLIYQRHVMPTGEPSGWLLDTVRDWSYGLTLINPYTTVTNLTDVLLTASTGSRTMLGGTVYEEAAKLLTGGKMTYTVRDFGFDVKKLNSIMAEFTDERKTRAWLNAGLASTGFKASDVFTKTVLINATYKELRLAALAGDKSGKYARLSAEYKQAFGKEDWPEFLDALRKGDKDNFIVKSAVLDRLLNQHPASLDDLPLGYINNPKRRVLYSLNTFFLKQIDLVRSRFLDRLKQGVKNKDKKLILSSVHDLFKYAILFGGGTQGVSWLKDFLLGREVDISDRSLNYVMQLAGLSKYTISRYRRHFDNPEGRTSEGLIGLLGSQLLPAAGKIVYDSLYPDIEEALTGTMKNTGTYRKLKILGIPTPITGSDVPFSDARMWRYMPWIGRDLYWSLGRGAEQERKKARRKASLGRPVPGGGPPFDLPRRFEGQPPLR